MKYITMKPGTIVRLPDGREGTVVYHHLDGYGIRWGRIVVDVEALNSFQASDDYYAPQAMLRDPYPTADVECVGEDYEVIPLEAVQGSWPADDPRRIFVEGAKWWQFQQYGATAFASEVDRMEREANRRYKLPNAPAAKTPCTSYLRGLTNDFCQNCGGTTFAHSEQRPTASDGPTKAQAE